MSYNYNRFIIININKITSFVKLQHFYITSNSSFQILKYSNKLKRRKI